MLVNRVCSDGNGMGCVCVCIVVAVVCWVLRWAWSGSSRMGGGMYYSRGVAVTGHKLSPVSSVWHSGQRSRGLYIPGKEGRGFGRSHTEVHFHAETNVDRD